MNYCFKKLEKSPVRIDVKIYHLQCLHVEIVLDFYLVFVFSKDLQLKNYFLNKVFNAMSLFFFFIE